MKLSEQGAKTHIFREIAERKQVLGDVAARLPRDRAEYTKLPVEQRMGVAERVVARYTPNPDRDKLYAVNETPASHRKEAIAEFEPEDQPGMLLRGNVENEVMPSTGRGRLRGLFIWAQAVDPVTKLESRSIPFGAVFAGRAVLDPDYNWDGQAVPLEDPVAVHIIEFIDEATIGLLESVVRDHRRFVGQQAVGETATA